MLAGFLASILLTYTFIIGCFLVKAIPLKSKNIYT